MTALRRFSSVVFVSLTMAIPACADNHLANRQAQQPVSMDEIHALYEQTQLRGLEPFRLPVRQQRQRAMKLLAEKAGQMLAQTENWSQSPRLTGLNTASAAKPQEMEQFRDTLKGLEAAASNRDRIRIMQEYSQLNASYKQLLASTQSPRNR